MFDISWLRYKSIAVTSVIKYENAVLRLKHVSSIIVSFDFDKPKTLVLRYK